MPKKVKWAPQTREDLLEIWSYFARIASPELADTILREVNVAGTKLGEHPLLWRTRDEILPGLRIVVIRPHLMFYRVSGEEVEIIRVMHEKRNYLWVLRNKK